jgi:hypothetical protein
LELSEVQAFGVDAVGEITRQAVQIEAVAIDKVAKRLDYRAIGPGHAGSELLRRERKARINQPHGHPDVVRERIIEQRRAHAIVWVRTP